MPSAVGLIADAYKAPAGGGGLPVAGAVGWWDASDAASITASGGAVSQWNDKSGNNRHVVNAGAGKPTTGSRQINSLNALLFNSSKLDVSFSQAQPLTIFLAAKLDTVVANSFFVYHVGASTPSVLAGNTNFWSLYAGTFLSSTAGAALQTTPFTFTAVFNGASSQILVNQTSLVTGNAGTGAISAFRFGDAPFAGLIGECIVYNTVLSTTDRQAVENYLMTKWGTAFVPTQIAGLQGWWDASDAASFTYSSGTVVSQWNDKSGNGNHASQGTVSNQPTRSGTQNGLATVVFDGTNDTLDTAAFTVPQPFTIFFATNSNAGTDATQGLIASAGTTGALQLYLSTGLSNLRVYGGSEFSGGVCDGVHAWCVVYNGASSSCIRDTGSALTGNPGSVGTTTGFRIGGTRTATANYYLTGAMFEVIIYSTTLSTTDRDTVMAYLKAKWGTP